MTTERRTLITAAITAETGIDEAMIERLVRTFYGAVRKDELIGPYSLRASRSGNRICNVCANSGLPWP
jgi:truncated hemoglobin YjbI